jgi:hypothetical protein
VKTDHFANVLCNLVPHLFSVCDTDLEILMAFLSPYGCSPCEKYCGLWPDIWPSRLEQVPHFLWMGHIPLPHFLCFHYIVAITVLVVTVCICSSSSTTCCDLYYLSAWACYPKGGLLTFSQQENTRHCLCIFQQIMFSYLLLLAGSTNIFKPNFTHFIGLMFWKICCFL